MKIKKPDSLQPGSREMEEGGRWEGQNFQQLKKVQRLEEEEEEQSSSGTKWSSTVDVNCLYVYWMTYIKLTQNKA